MQGVEETTESPLALRQRAANIRWAASRITKDAMAKDLRDFADALERQADQQFGRARSAASTAATTASGTAG